MALLLCHQCREEKPLEEFSKRQSKASWRRCTACIDKTDGPGSSKGCTPSLEGDLLRKRKFNQVAAFEQKVSHGQIDQRAYKVKQITDRARRPTKPDKAAAAAAAAAFSATFKLLGPEARYERIFVKELNRLSELSKVDSKKAGEQLKALRAADTNFQQLEKLEPHPQRWWSDAAQLTDFLTTLREPGSRVTFDAAMSGMANDVRPKGTFPDAPFMSPFYDLKYSAKQGGGMKFSISSLPTDRIKRHVGGTALLKEGVLVAGRCASQLPANIRNELIRMHKQLQHIMPYLHRGMSVASVCRGFCVIGYKPDQNTGQCLPHAPADATDADTRFETKEAFLKLRSLYTKHIHPLVMETFGVLFAPVTQHLVCAGLELFACQVSGVTFGDLFWPRSHTDPDVWYTVLVPIDYGAGITEGGDFAFGEAGWVLQCEFGDVLIINPQMVHGTTEFRCLGEHDGRAFAAFYMKAATLKASAVSNAIEHRGCVRPLKLEYGFVSDDDE